MAQVKILSLHATKQAYARGFPTSVVRFVARHADVEKPAREGRKAVFVSPTKARLLGWLGLDDKAVVLVSRCCLILDGEALITVHDGADMARDFD